LSIASTTLVISSEAYITSASKSMIWRPFSEEKKLEIKQHMPRQKQTCVSKRPLFPLLSSLELYYWI
jgi:hypothetical protein